MDLSLAFFPNLIFSVLIGISYLIYFKTKGYYDFDDFDEIIVLVSIFMTAIISTFCFIFPISNTLINIIPYLKSKSFNKITEILREEIGNGILPLRITSIVTGFNTIITIYRTFKLQLFPFDKEEVKKLFYFKEFNELKLDPKTSTFRNRMAHLYLNVLQNTFYLLSIIVLWITFYANKHGISSVILSYILLYIIDDWAIIFKYSLSLKGRILKYHRNQIVIFNIIILALALVCSFSIGWLLVVIYIILIVSTMRLLLLLFLGIEGEMIVVQSINWRHFDKSYDEWTGERK